MAMYQRRGEKRRKKERRRIKRIIKKMIHIEKKMIYCVSRKKMHSGIFAITQEWKELESCGFHHSKEKSVGHQSM
jgi:hypothetical protein